MQTQLIQNPTGNWWSLRLLEVLFAVNEAITRSTKIRHFLWSLIKVELFYVAGTCKHTGFCCQKVAIFHDGTAMKSETEWISKVAQNPKSLARFEPVIDQNQIKYFNCNCLTSDMKCAQYSTRPGFCRAYPFSNFVSEIPLYEKCGYHVELTQLRLRSQGIRLSRLVRRLQLIYRIQNDGCS